LSIPPGLADSLTVNIGGKVSAASGIAALAIYAAASGNSVLRRHVADSYILVFASILAINVLTPLGGVIHLRTIVVVSSELIPIVVAALVIKSQPLTKALHAKHSASNILRNLLGAIAVVDLVLAVAVMAVPVHVLPLLYPGLPASSVNELNILRVRGLGVVSLATAVLAGRAYREGDAFELRRVGQALILGSLAVIVNDYHNPVNGHLHVPSLALHGVCVIALLVALYAPIGHSVGDKHSSSSGKAAAAAASSAPKTPRGRKPSNATRKSE